MIHRHLDLPPETPVNELPRAAVHDLLERGDLDDWRPLLRVIEAEPDGRVARSVAHLVDAYPMYGTSPLLRSWIERCRNRARAARRSEPESLTLADLRRSLGKTQTEVAEVLGMSQSDYSKLERRKDVRVSTLRSAAAALEGRLRLFVELANRLVEIEVAAKPVAEERGSRIRSSRASGAAESPGQRRK